MLHPHYAKLDLVTFGRHLFSSGDLDPVYLALQGAGFERSQLARWLVAYWCFYNAGFACYASERSGDLFWNVLRTAAHNSTVSPIGGRWPRGAERRHFRGKESVKAIAELSSTYPIPERFLDAMCNGPMDVGSVIARANEHPLFGSWIGFKVADMIDAIWLPGGVVQDDISCFLYDTPRQSIQENYESGLLGQLPRPNTDLYEYAMSWLCTQLRDQRIPHKPSGRTPDWFSLETVWCKHLSHMHGAYPLYKDMDELYDGVKPWFSYTKRTRAAERFWGGLPKRVRESYDLW